MNVKICSFEGCGRKRLAKGLCGTHYSQHRRGEELRPVLRRGSPLKERLNWYIKKEGTCSIWAGALNRSGYAQTFYKGQSRLAHRLMYEIEVGPIPEGLELDHLCYRRDCINPEHLLPVTKSMNMQNRAGANRNSGTGVRGVNYDKRSGKYAAQVGHTTNGVRKNHWIGYFDTIDEAEKAVIAKRNEIFFYNRLDRKAA